MGRHSKPTVWTPEMVSKLHELFRQGKTDMETAKALGVSINAVTHKRGRLGLSKGAPNLPLCPRPKDMCIRMDKAKRCRLLSDTHFDRPCPFYQKEV